MDLVIEKNKKAFPALVSARAPTIGSASSVEDLIYLGFVADPSSPSCNTHSCSAPLWALSAQRGAGGPEIPCSGGKTVACRQLSAECMRQAGREGAGLSGPLHAGPCLFRGLPFRSTKKHFRRPRVYPHHRDGQTETPGPGRVAHDPSHSELL